MSQPGTQGDPATQEGQPPAEPEAPKPGTPEYDAAMIAKADERGAGNGDEFKPVDANGKWLGKYDSPEELAKAYDNLQRKLGEQGSQPKPEGEPAESEGEKPEGDETNDVNLERPKGDEKETEGEPSVIQEFASKYAENGNKFTDEDYAALEEKGFDRATVQVYEAGLQSIVQERSKAAVDAVGGQDQFEQVRNWASKELDDASFDAFNKQLREASSPEEVGLVYETLAARYRKATGEPDLVGDTTRPTGDGQGGGFATRSEMTTAMNDPRYQTDPEYRKQVQTKVERATFL